MRIDDDPASADRVKELVKMAVREFYTRDTCAPAAASAKPNRVRVASNVRPPPCAACVV